MKKQGGSPHGETGQTLIEILLAFSALILVLSAIIIGITTSLNNTQYTRNQNLANSYAQEAMAVVRKIRDSSWPDFYSKTDVNYCIPQNVVILASYDGLNCARDGKIGIFVRSVRLEHDSLDCSSGSIKGSKASVKVSWSDNKCPIGSPYCHKVELITCFSNLDQKQAP